MDRSTITRIQVAKQRALADLSPSKPGAPEWARDHELDTPKAGVVRLAGGAQGMAVESTLVEGKGGWD